MGTVKAMYCGAGGEVAIRRGYPGTRVRESYRHGGSQWQWLTIDSVLAFLETDTVTLGPKAS